MGTSTTPPEGQDSRAMPVRSHPPTPYPTRSKHDLGGVPIDHSQSHCLSQLACCPILVLNKRALLQKEMHRLTGQGWKRACRTLKPRSYTRVIDCEWRFNDRHSGPEQRRLAVGGRRGMHGARRIGPGREEGVTGWHGRGRGPARSASSEALTGSGRGEAAGLLACAAIVRSIGEVSRKDRNELVRGV
jgi:hypothetical protein